MFDDKFQNFPILIYFKAIFVKNKWQLILLAIIVCLIYINGINSDFVSDDRQAILFNPNIVNLKYIFSSTVPLQPLSIYIINKLVGMSPVAYRSVNIIVHMINVCIVYLLLQKMINRETGIIAAMLFAVHPILIESVTWISGGTYSKAALFFLVSFYLFINSNRLKMLYVSSLIFFVLSLLTSEKLIPMSILFIVYDWTYNENFKKKIFLKNFIYILISFIFGLIWINMLSQRQLEISQISYNLVDRSIGYSTFEQIIIAISEYFRLIIWPSNLSIYHTELFFTYMQYMARAFVVITFVFVIFIALGKLKGGFRFLMHWKKLPLPGHQLSKGIFFWGVFFLTSIGVTVTLVSLGIAWIVAERYVYLGSIGIFAIIGLLLDRISRNESMRVFVYTVFAVAILVLSIRTIIRNQDWKNEDTLWIATAKTSPSSPNTHNNMGDVYSRHQDFENAIKEFSRAIEINSRYADAYHNRGVAYQNIGDFARAMKDFETALDINPNLWQSAQNLAGIYFDNGDFNMALQYMEYAFSKNQSIPLAYNLAIAYSKIGKIEESRSILISILANDPNNEAVKSILSNIGN